MAETKTKTKPRKTNAEILREMKEINDACIEEGEEPILSPRMAEAIDNLFERCEGLGDDHINLEFNKILKSQVVAKKGV